MYEIEVKDCVLYDAFIMLSRQNTKGQYHIDEGTKSIRVSDYMDRAETTHILIYRLCRSFGCRMVKVEGYYSIQKRN